VGTVRIAVVLVVLLSAGCERGLEPPPDAAPRSPHEIAAALLRVELDLASLEDYLRTATSLPQTKERLDAVQFLRRHVERCAQWAAFIDYDPDAASAASVGSDLVASGTTWSASTLRPPSVT